MRLNMLMSLSALLTVGTKPLAEPNAPRVMRTTWLQAAAGLGISIATFSINRCERTCRPTSVGPARVRVRGERRPHPIYGLGADLEPTRFPVETPFSAVRDTGSSLENFLSRSPHLVTVLNASNADYPLLQCARLRSQSPADRVAMMGHERGRFPVEHSLIRFLRSRRIRLRSATRCSMIASLCSASVRVSAQL